MSEVTTKRVSETSSSQVQQAADSPNFNIWAFIEMIQQKTLKTNQEFEKLFTKKEEAGVFLNNMMKAISSSVSKDDLQTPYKNAEKIIANEYKSNEGRKISAYKALALNDLAQMANKLKANDAEIKADQAKIDQDNQNVKNDTAALKKDTSEKKDAVDHLKSWKDIFIAWDEYWGARAIYFLIKMGNDGKKLKVVADQLSSDTTAQTTVIQQNSKVFNSTRSSLSEQAGSLLTIGKQEMQALQDSSRGIMQGAANLYSPV